MNLLTIDIGNSRCKASQGIAGGPFPGQTVTALALDELVSRCPGFAEVDCCVVSSVNQEASRKLKVILSRQVASHHFLFLDFQSAPLEINVQQPQTLGADRIAAAYAGFLRTGGATIVVDSGTAVTVDLVDSKGVFCGGAIFPGAELSAAALAQYTDGLPLAELNLDHPPDLPGKNTLDAIRAGLFWSQLGGVQQIVQEYLSQIEGAQLLVTGGCGEQVLASTQLPGSYIPDLVLEGLWRLGSDRFTGEIG
jgi:type III pantothenate kinase